MKELTLQKTREKGKDFTMGMYCDMEEYFSAFDSWRTQYLPDNVDDIEDDIFYMLSDFDHDICEYDVDWGHLLNRFTGDVCDEILLDIVVIDDPSAYGFADSDYNDEIHCYCSDRGFCFQFANRYMGLVIKERDMDKVQSTWNSVRRSEGAFWEQR